LLGDFLNHSDLGLRNPEKGDYEVRAEVKVLIG
jgi:hypothetical protein